MSNERQAAIANYLDSLAAQDVEIQVQLRGTAAAIGPAKIQRRVTNESDAGHFDGTYKMLQAATIQTTQHGPKTNVILPIVFHVDEVQAVIEPMINVDDGKPTIITPGGGKRSAGGLHLGG